MLTDIDFDYLLLWGHYRLMAELHERLQGKLTDPTLKMISVVTWARATRNGQIPKAIACYERALALAREAKNRQGEGALLGNLGNCYAGLGQSARAIEYHEQALVIDRGSGIAAGRGLTSATWVTATPTWGRPPAPSSPTSRR